MRVLGALLGVGVALAALTGCAADGDSPGPTSRTDEVPSPEMLPADAAVAGRSPDQAESASDDAPGGAARTLEDAGAPVLAASTPGAGDPATGAMGYAEAYQVLYAATSPSDLLVDRWNAATDAREWARVRSTSALLAEALQTLQTLVLASDWPADARDAAQDFALALDQEIGWYSYVAIARDDGETVDAVQQPWSDAAVTASDELWTILADGVAASP